MGLFVINGVLICVMLYQVKTLWKLKDKVEKILDFLVFLTTVGSITFLVIHFIVNYVLETSPKNFYYLQTSLEIGDFSVLFAGLNLVFYFQIFPIYKQVKNFTLSVSWILLKLISGFSLPILVGFGLFFISRYEPGSKPTYKVYFHMLSNTFSLMFGNVADDPYSIYFPQTSDTLTPYALEVFVIFIMGILAYIVTNVLLAFSINQVEHYMQVAELNRIKHMFIMCKLSTDTQSQLTNLKKITIKKVSQNKTIYGRIYKNSGNFTKVSIPTWIIEHTRKILDKKEQEDQVQIEKKTYRDGLDEKLKHQNDAVLQQSDQIKTSLECFFNKQQQEIAKLIELNKKQSEIIEKQSQQLENQALLQTRATDTIQSEMALLRESIERMSKQ